MKDNILTAIFLICMTIYVIAGYIYTYNKPYNLTMCTHIPWWAWLDFVVGITAYIFLLKNRKI